MGVLNKNFVERLWFLSQVCIKVLLPSPQNETTLSHTTHAIGVLFLRYCLLVGQSTSARIALVEVMLPKMNRREGWNKNVLGGEFLKN